MYQHMAWRLDGAEAAQAEFERLVTHADRTNPNRKHWYLAVINGDGDFCGITGFDHRRDGLGEFGWYLSPQWWGRGLATATTRLLLDFGFVTVGVPAITARATRRTWPHGGSWKSAA